MEENMDSKAQQSHTSKSNVEGRDFQSKHDENPVVAVIQCNAVVSRQMNPEIQCWPGRPQTQCNPEKYQYCKSDRYGLCRSKGRFGGRKRERYGVRVTAKITY